VLFPELDLRRCLDFCDLHGLVAPRRLATIDSSHPELIEIVISPTHDGPVRPYRTRVGFAEREMNGIRQSFDGDRERASRFGRRILAGAELTDVVAPPTGDAALTDDRAVERIARGDFDDVRQVHDRLTPEEGVLVPDTELALVVGAPARHARTSPQNAIVRLTGGELHRIARVLHGHGEPEDGLARGVLTISALPLVVVTPAFDSAGRVSRAGMVMAR
jgi:hypothetical protein